jgi:HlyD family secretion protein
MTTRSILVRRWGQIALGLLLLAGFALVVLRSGPLAPIRITVTTIDEGNITSALFGIGSIEARRAYAIGPISAGRVRRVLVDVGDTVTAGQLLAEMEPVDLDERGAALDAGIARAQSALAAATAQRQDAQARWQLATANAQRYLDLGSKQFVSPGAIEGKQQEQLSAQAANAAAAANLASAKQEITRAKAEREGLQQQRNNLRLVATSGGVITSRDAEPGSTVVAGQSVIKLIDPASLWVKVRFDQGRSTGLAVGLPAAIVLRSNPGKAQRGQVARLELLSDNVTEERIAQVVFDAIPNAISVGELAEVTLTLPPDERGLLLPNSSLKRQGKLVGVWRLEDDKLRFAEVTPGNVSLDGQVLIRTGLNAGDRIVVHSEKELAGNSRFKIVDALVGAP